MERGYSRRSTLPGNGRPFQQHMAHERMRVREHNLRNYFSAFDAFRDRNFPTHLNPHRIQREYIELSPTEFVNDFQDAIRDYLQAVFPSRDVIARQQVGGRVTSSYGIPIDNAILERVLEEGDQVAQTFLNYGERQNGHRLSGIVDDLNDYWINLVTEHEEAMQQRIYGSGAGAIS